MIFIVYLNYTMCLCIAHISWAAGKAENHYSDSHGLLGPAQALCQICPLKTRFEMTRVCAGLLKHPLHLGAHRVPAPLFQPYAVVTNRIQQAVLPINHPLFCQCRKTTKTAKNYTVGAGKKVDAFHAI